MGAGEISDFVLLLAFLAKAQSRRVRTLEFSKELGVLGDLARKTRKARNPTHQRLPLDPAPLREIHPNIDFVNGPYRLTTSCSTRSNWSVQWSQAKRSETSCCAWRAMRVRRSSSWSSRLM